MSAASVAQGPWPDDSLAPCGTPWWQLTRTPGMRRRFGGEKRIAAYLYFNVEVGETFTMRQLRESLGTDGVAESAFTRRIPASIARRTLVTVATLAPDAYPGRAIIGRSDPYKIYGYEAMKLILDSGAATKEGVLAFLRGVSNRAGVLGTYGFDANGDTTLRTYGLYTIRGRTLRWVGAITAA